MIEIMFEKDKAILKFPKQLMAMDYVQQFLEKLRVESIIEKSKLTEEQAWELSEQIKEEWWNKNRERILKRIKD
ncbi:MAG: hypothetical protein LWW95_00585 [Candidatus Desulfofervidus auxilii]|nr:hypothetical protein [Candidatus Desulfofervidus auxilii]